MRFTSVFFCLFSAMAPLGLIQLDRANGMDVVDVCEKNEDCQTMKITKNKLEEDAYNMDNYLNSTQSGQLAAKIKEAISAINGILDEYGIEKTAIAFNGGKDSTLLLHLLRICVTKKFGADTKISAFFIKCDDEFIELVHFVQKMASMYNLDLVELSGPMKHGLALYKEKQSHTVATMMGTRSTDPIGKYMKSNIQWTDGGWPKFLRVCPLFDWSYGEVWKGIRDLSISYCSLYDAGFSSLGECTKTTKNPALLIKGTENSYKPAYTLNDGKLERSNREQSDPKL
ncbi:hypothetical protein niasHT_027058 [Heterodera trifolii]|uniref:FAD synthase n=1 Tax=Heterodera trifolii TaxID=157864 RepID=A0ABD2JG52_9BILA